MRQEPSLEAQEPVADSLYYKLSQEKLDEYGESNISEKEFAQILSTLNAIAKIIRPDASVRYQGGYYFFPSFTSARTLSDGRLFDSKVRSENERIILNFLEDFKRDTFTENEKSAKDMLAQEYKIHLMPKAEYIPFVLDILTRGIAGNKKLQSKILTYKVIGTPPSVHEKIQAPTIVIYPLLGGHTAQEVLDEIRAIFSGYSGLGIGKDLPFNRKVTDLIYYAQGDRRFKQKCVRIGAGEDRMQKIFDEEKIHFSGGDYTLNIGV